MFDLKKPLVLLVASLALAGSAAAAPRITSQLEMDRSWLTGEDDVNVRFSLTNEGDTATTILKWQTPFEGIDDDLFTVARNGEPVTYLGRHIKRPAPTAADFMTLAPGQKVSVQVELSKYYDMAMTGEYTIVYNQTLQSQKSRFNETASNAVSFWVEGSDVPVQQTTETDVDGNTRALTPTYTSCSTSQRSSIVTALSSAQTYAVNAYSYLSTRTTTAQRDASTRYKTWFGTQTSSRWSTVQSHFLNIRNTIQTKTLAFDCSCTDSYYAYVYPASPYKIYLCSAFWSAPNTGTDSKAGTIVHELSHFNVVAATDDWAYGQASCKSLATSNPSRATDNADSHEYFAENTPSLP